MAGHAEQTKSRIEIGLRIKNSRKKRLLKGEDCAKLYGTSRSNWSHMENGRAAFDSEELLKLGDFLKVDPAWLLTGRKELEPEWLKDDKEKS